MTTAHAHTADHTADATADSPADRNADRSAWPVLVVAVAGFVLLGTRQAFTVPYTGLGLPLAQLLLLLLSLVWVATRLLGQRGAAALGLLTALLLVRVGCTLVSYGLAAARVLSPDLQDSADRALLNDVFAALIVVVLATVLVRARDVELVLRALVAGGALSAIFALVQFAGGPDVASMLKPPAFAERQSVLVTTLLREGLARTQGAASHPLELGAVSALLVPLGIGLFYAARRRGGRAWPWALAAIIIASGGAVSLSRSTFLGIAAALVVMAPRWPVRRLGSILGGVVLVVVTGSLLVPRLATALRLVFTEGSDDYSLQSRANGRSYVWNTFADHFWFGQGPGTYDLSRQQIVDNNYLSLLTEGGVLSLLASTAVVVCAFGYAWRAGSRDVAGSLAELSRGIAGALGAAIVVSLVIDVGGFAALYTLIALLVGLAAAVWRLATGGIRPDATAGVTPTAAPAR